MSRRQDAFSWIAIALALIIAITIVLFTIGPDMSNRGTIRLGDAVLTGKSIKTHSDGQVMLATNRQLQPGEADLIIFSGDKKWEVDPDDIKVAADLIWLDSDHTVVYIVKNIEPDSLSAENLRPNENSRYLLEVSTGTVDGKMIRIGSEAVFGPNIEVGKL